MPKGNRVHQRALRSFDVSLGGPIAGDSPFYSVISSLVGERPKPMAVLDFFLDSVTLLLPIFIVTIYRVRL